jgi:hypothetical protein
VNLRELPAKKTVKLLALVLTSLLIASVSAAVYYSMFMEPKVTTAAADVYFVAGGDSTAAGATGYGTNGTWVRLASLKAYPNVTLTYEEAINITNGGSGWHEIRLRHSSISPNGTSDVGNFTSITFKLIAANGTQVGGDFSYTVTGNNWNAPSDMFYQGIPAGETWAVRVETVAVSGALPDISVEIDIIVDVR